MFEDGYMGVEILRFCIYLYLQISKILFLNEESEKMRTIYSWSYLVCDVSKGIHVNFPRLEIGIISR